MGLYRQAILLHQIAKAFHKLIAAGWRKTWGKNGKCIFVRSLNLFNPLPRCHKGSLGGVLAKNVGAVAIHIHFTHIGFKSRGFKLIHKKLCCRNVQRCKDGSTSSRRMHKIIDKDVIRCRSIFQGLVFTLFRKRICIEPVQELQIHRNATERILRSMYMYVI